MAEKYLVQTLSVCMEFIRSVLKIPRGVSESNSSTVFESLSPKYLSHSPRKQNSLSAKWIHHPRKTSHSSEVHGATMYIKIKLLSEIQFQYVRGTVFDVIALYIRLELGFLPY